MNELPPTLLKLTKSARLKHYPKNQTLIYQEDKPHEIFILLSGYVKVYDIDREGNEKILHILRPGSLLPFVFFSGLNEEVRWFYSALTDCEVYVFSYAQMLTEVRQNIDLLLYLVQWFSMEVHEMLARLSSLGKSSAQMKIKAALSFLASYAANKNSGDFRRIEFPVNHQLLADMTGLTRESAAMIMKDLVKKQIVRNPRQTILEINPNKLA